MGLLNKSRYEVDFSSWIWLFDDLSLHGVLYIPQFHFNILSISMPLKDMPHLLVEFSNTSYILEDKSTSRMIGRGSSLHGLYPLDNMHVPVAVSNLFVPQLDIHLPLCFYY